MMGVDKNEVLDQSHHRKGNHTLKHLNTKQFAQAVPFLQSKVKRHEALFETLESVFRAAIQQRFYPSNVSNKSFSDPGEHH